nr:NAC domain-containing protein [Tanacetum cinerariifolium]
MNPNGDRPNRRTRDFGYWKTTQKDSMVCDDASGLEVGKRRCLVYYDASNKKILTHHQGSSYQTSASTLVYQQQLHSTYQDNQSDESNEDNFSYNYEEVLELDYADSINPGYRFSPTEPETIVYYLRRKIETREQHPECRYYIAIQCAFS